MLAMSTTLRTAVLRYVGMFAGLAAVVAAGRYLDVNPTAVALLFLIAVLLVSAYWGLRFAVVLSLVATAAFNFFFLPPLYTFTISDDAELVCLGGIPRDGAGGRQPVRASAARGGTVQTAKA